jgi:hypothetical protein
MLSFSPVVAERSRSSNVRASTLMKVRVVYEKKIDISSGYFFTYYNIFVRNANTDFRIQDIRTIRFFAGQININYPAFFHISHFMAHMKNAVSVCQRNSLRTLTGVSDWDFEKHFTQKLCFGVNNCDKR